MDFFGGGGISGGGGGGGCGGGRRWAVLGNCEGIKERVQRTDGSSEDQGVVLWASPLQVVVKNCKFQRCWH